MLKYTTDELEAAVRKTAYLPPVGGMTQDEVLEFINQERASTMSELIKRASPSYWRTYYDHTIVAGTSEYRIPDRALMNGIEEAVYIDSNSQERPVVELEASERWKYAAGGSDPHWPSDMACIMEGEHIRLVPAPSTRHAGRTLRLYYYRQPSVMVPVARAFAITSASAATLLTGSMGASSEMDKSDEVDIVRGAGMYGPIFIDKAILNTPTTEISLSPLDHTLISSNGGLESKRTDYACMAGETVYTEFPVGLWPVLVSAAAVAVLTAQKDFAHADFESRRLEKKIASAAFLAEPRSHEPEVIINRSSPLRRGRFYSR